MNKWVIAAGVLLVGASAVHLYVLARAMPFRVDFIPEEPFRHRWAWYLNLTAADGWNPTRYTAEGRHWVGPIKLTSLLAGLALIVFVLAIVAR